MEIYYKWVWCLYITVHVHQVVAARGEFHDPGIIWTEFETFRQKTYIQSHSTDINENSDVQQQQGVIAVNGPPNRYYHVAASSKNKTLVLFNKPKKSIVIRRYIDFERGALGFIHLGQAIEWTLFANTSYHVNGLCVDELTDNVYWTDSTYDAIFVSGLRTEDLMDPLVLIDNDLDVPYGITVFPQEGILFWTDNGKNPKIERASMSGKNRKVILTEGIGRPGAITVDVIEKRLYWVSVNTAIRSCDINGNDVRYITSLHGRFMSSLVIYKDDLIGVTPKPANLLVLDKINGTIKLRKELSRNPFGLTIYNRKGGFNVPDNSDQCNETQCTTLCVTDYNNTKQCLCPTKVSYKGNTSTVECDKSGLYGTVLLATDKGLYYLWRNYIELSRVRPSGVYVGQTYGTLAVDSINDLVFVFEETAKVIKKIDLRLNTEETIVRVAESVKDIAVDWMSRILFWSDTETMSIMASNYDGTYPVKIISNMSGLCTTTAIAVHPELRYLFWSNVAMNTVEMSTLDGSLRRCFTRDTVQVTAMVIDFKDDYLYMFDRLSYQIKTLDMNGETRNSFTIEETHIRSLAVLNDYLIWTTIFQGSSGIKSVNKTTGRNSRKIFFENMIVNGVSFNHITKHPTLADPCVDQTKCDQICLPVSSQYYNMDYRCKCSSGYQLTANNTCQQIPTKPHDYLIVVDQRAPSIYKLDLSSNTIATIPIGGLKEPFAVAIDSSQSIQVYWSDVSLRTINRIKLDGSCQEIIYANKIKLLLDIVIDVVSVSLYATDIANDRILVISLINLSTSYIDAPQPLASYIDAGWWPIALTLYEKTRELMIASCGREPTLSSYSISEKNYTNRSLSPWLLSPRAIAISSDVIYWIERDRISSSIYRSTIDGNNFTALIFSPRFMPRDIALGKNSLYWSDAKTNNIWRHDFTSGQNKPLLSDFRLFKPAGIVLVENHIMFRASKRSSRNSKCLNIHHGLPTISIETNLYCRVPQIEYGVIVNNYVGAYVSNGVQITVKCFEAHKLSDDRKMVCRNGEWSVLPQCIRDFNLFGDKTKGWSIFLTSGKFYVYETMEVIYIYCIGGGGGGYDSLTFNDTAHAGDGGTSIVYTPTDVICHADGGKGGGPVKGGAGGSGDSETGENGEDINSLRGGSCLKNVLCGPGGIYTNCSEQNYTTNDDKMCNNSQNSINGGLYGAGSASRLGGAGGGGGFDYIMYNKRYGKILTMEVGKGGQPSFGKAGQGVIVVSWGLNENELFKQILAYKLKQGLYNFEP